MSKRSKWTDFDKQTKKYIKNRDNNKCVICHCQGALQCMHIFMSRAQGGKGDKKNGCLGCVICHRILDNPLGKKENELSVKYMNYCKKYLIEKENIKDIEKLREELRFKKDKIIF